MKTSLFFFSFIVSFILIMGVLIAIDPMGKVVSYHVEMEK